MNERQKAYLQHYQQKCLKLPPHLASMANKYFIQYFNEFVNVIDCYNDEPFPDGYIPRSLEVYYGVLPTPNIQIIDGILEDYTLPEIERNNPSITVMIDGSFAYIEIEGQEILNKIGGAILPQIIANPCQLLNNLINRGIS